MDNVTRKLLPTHTSSSSSSAASSSSVALSFVNVTTTLFTSNVTEYANITTPWTEDPKEAPRDFWIGLALAVSSACFTGSSYILKKKGLLNVAQGHGQRASDGGFVYLKEWLWWIGMITMIIGEILNFLAYLFAPASLVTPLGALSVITSAIMSSYFLKEKLNLLGKVGCMLCLLGSTLVVVHSPHEQEIQTMAELLHRISEPGIIVFAVALVGIALVLLFFVAPRYGNKNVLVYVTINSTLGSFTVMGAKGFGVAIKETIRGRNEFKNVLTYIMATIVVACSLIELIFLNKSLDIFNTAIVTPTYYVIFTSCAVMFSLVLFKEFGRLDVQDIVGALIGFIVICVGIFILNAFRHMNVSLRNLPKAIKPNLLEIASNGEIVHTVGHDSHELLDEIENHEEINEDSTLFDDAEKLTDCNTPDKNSNIRSSISSHHNISLVI